MATYTKEFLSASAHGRAIVIASTSAPGDTVHTAVTGTAKIDEMFVYAMNTSTTMVKLTVLFGGTRDPGDFIEVTIPGESGLFLVIPGLPLNNGLAVTAFAGTANVINLYGFANRIG